VPKVIYSMSPSLDGFIADRSGGIDWSAPDAELHRFHNQRVAGIGVQLLGRRLYEVMTYWDTVEEDPASDEIELEFARIWKALPKIVFSRTLTEVTGNATLATEEVADVVARLKQEQEGDIAVGGAGLAAACIERNLVDEYELFFNPVVLGGGTPYFPAFEGRIDLELAETRTFGSRVVYLRYVRPAP
jgi:dihydrofolate reductase